MAPLTVNSVIRMKSGFDIPALGYGVSYLTLSRQQNGSYCHRVSMPQFVWDITNQCHSFYPLLKLTANIV